MIDSKELCQRLGISGRTLTTWRNKVTKISGRKFKMEANPRGYSHYLYSDKDLEQFQELAKKIRKTGDIDSSVRSIFGDRYREMIQEEIEFVDLDIERLKEKIKELQTQIDNLDRLCKDDRKFFIERIEQLEKAFETEQGKGAWERLGFKKSRTD